MARKPSIPGWVCDSVAQCSEVRAKLHVAARVGGPVDNGWATLTSTVKVSDV